MPLKTPFILFNPWQWVFPVYEMNHASFHSIISRPERPTFCTSPEDSAPLTHTKARFISFCDRARDVRVHACPEQGVFGEGDNEGHTAPFQSSLEWLSAMQVCKQLVCQERLINETSETKTVSSYSFNYLKISK